MLSAAAGSLSLGQWAACGATAVLIAGSLVAYTAFADAFGIDTESIDQDAWGDRPPSVDGLHNILLLGTDERAGDDASYNELHGIRPDVMVIVSIDVDNGGVTMVNLPRDLVVELPPCEPNGDFDGTPGGQDHLNHAMRYGGMDCQGNAVETITDVHLDHMVTVDFAGFENIVDTIGGVTMCVPEPIDDPKADLRLDAGEQVLDGSQALGLARSRDSTEHGSDLDRIENQQRMIGAILREVTEGDILTSPSTLLNFLDSVTDSLVTDEDFTLDVMMELAVAMREVDLERMNMVTVPVMDHPTDSNRVVFQEPAAQELLAKVAAGEVLPEENEGDDGGSDDGDHDVEPEDVSLTVLNNTGQDGLATEVEVLLNAEGFTVVGTGNPGLRAPEETTVYHGPDQEAHAELVASALTTARTEEVPDLGEDLELVMGIADWGPVVGLDGGGGDGDDDGETPLAGLDSTTAADDDEVSCD